MFGGGRGWVLTGDGRPGSFRWASIKSLQKKKKQAELHCVNGFDICSFWFVKKAYTIRRALTQEFFVYFRELQIRKHYKKAIIVAEDAVKLIYQYSNTALGLSSKSVLFVRLFCLSIPKRALDTKKTLPNIEICPESRVAMLEY